MQNKNSKVSTWITKPHKPCLEGQEATWSELELDLERSKAYTRLETQKRTSNERFADKREQDYKLRFISISKTYDRLFHKEKYPKLELIHIKLYLQNRRRKNLVKFYS
jgi:hypothetical protein